MKSYLALLLTGLFLLTVPRVNGATERLDSLFDILHEHNKLMGSIAVLHKGEHIYQQSSGFRNIDGDEVVPSDIQTRYHIGSITKTYTSVMILQLIEAEKLSFETTLDNFFPEMPNAGSITIEEMLLHRSGLYNFTSSPGYRKYFTENPGKEALLDTFAALGTEFDPGVTTSYSNTNYVLLGYIIEDVTGKPYGEVLQEMIVKPLGLEKTRFAGTIDPGNNNAYSFHYRDGNWTKAIETDMTIPHGAGAVLSTASEVNTFFEAIFNRILISEPSLKKMIALRDGMGMGLIRLPFYEHSGYGHTGGIDGFSSIAVHFPEDSLTVTLLANGSNYTINNVLVGVLSIVMDYDYEMPEFEDREPYKHTEEELLRFEGVYSTTDLPMEITIWVENGRLMAQGTGQASFPLSATGEKRFEFSAVGAEFEFGHPENGSYNGFTLRQAGGSYWFDRKSE